MVFRSVQRPLINDLLQVEQDGSFLGPNLARLPQRAHRSESLILVNLFIAPHTIIKHHIIHVNLSKHEVFDFYLKLLQELFVKLLRDVCHPEA